MADRYWVGGTGTWDATTTTNWSTTSGGAGGASAPTSADDVYFDAGSDAGGVFTVTIGTGAVCRDITAGSLDFVMTLAGSAAWVISGSLTFPATNLTRTYTGAITFNATTTGKTITTNGVSFESNITFNGANGEWILGSALVAFTVATTAGTFRTNNFNVTCGINFIYSGTLVRAVYLGSSVITVSGSLGANVNTNLTFDAGTSSIVMSNNFAGLDGVSQTYYNVSFTNTSSGTLTITGANTFNDLTFTSPSATGIRNISVNANQTINGTLTFGTANTAIRRMFVFSNTIGTARTLTADTVATLADVDFRDIVGAGLGTWSGTRLGNCGGNTGITFDAGKTVYWNLAGTQFWSATAWATTNNGTPDVNNFPLAQDTAVITEAGAAGTVTLVGNPSWNIGTLTLNDGISPRTSPVTLSASGTAIPAIYGDIKCTFALTVSGNVIFSFAGRTLQNVTSDGVTLHSFEIANVGDGVKLLDNVTLNRSSFSVSYIVGKLDLNNFTLTGVNFLNGMAVRNTELAFGTTGKMVLTGNNTTVVNVANTTLFTVTGSKDVECTYTGADGTRIFVTNNPLEEQFFNYKITGGTDILSLGQVSFGFKSVNLDFTGFNGSTSANQQLFIYGDLTYSSGMTIGASNAATTFAKSSGTQTLTTNGKTLDFPVTKEGAGTLQLLDNTTIGSTRTLTHTAGTIDLNDNTLTTGIYLATGSDARSIDFGTGTLAVGGNFTASGSNYTTTGTGSVSMTSASGKTFAGGGFTYPTLNQGGAGTLTITGANTFNNITNTNATASTITFPASTVTRVLNMKLKGNISNLVSMRSSIDGTTYTIQT